MGRPALPPGTPGKLTTKQLPNGQWRSRCQFRDYDGHTRPIARYAATKTKAEAALKSAIADRQRDGQAATTAAGTRVTELLDTWLIHVEADAALAVGTRQQYRKIADSTVKPAIGEYRVGELTVPVCDRALRAIRQRHGYSVAKSARAVMSGAIGWAVQQGALPTNPVRDVGRLSAGKKSAPRALDEAEADEWIDFLRTNQRAIDLDLPDLIEHGLGTGARIGEVLAARADTLDLEAGTWLVDSTVIRVKGRGLVIQSKPKSGAGHRLLALPGFLVDMHRRRDQEVRLRPSQVTFYDPADGSFTLRPVRLAFPSVHAKALRDPSNTAGDIRELRKAAGLGWYTYHTNRKTVATILDRGGQSARQGADQLGHAKTSLFLDVYTGRKVANPDAAKLLER